MFVVSFFWRYANIYRYGVNVRDHSFHRPISTEPTKNWGTKTEYARQGLLFDMSKMNERLHDMTP